MSELDINGDGKVDKRELDIYETKTKNHRRVAYFALAAIIGFTAILMTPLISVERVNALADIFSMFYLSLGTVIGAYMGVSGWMSRK